MRKLTAEELIYASGGQVGSDPLVLPPVTAKNPWGAPPGMPRELWSAPIGREQKIHIWKTYYQGDYDSNPDEKDPFEPMYDDEQSWKEFCDELQESLSKSEALYDVSKFILVASSVAALLGGKPFIMIGVASGVVNYLSELHKDKIKSEMDQFCKSNPFAQAVGLSSADIIWTDSLTANLGNFYNSFKAPNIGGFN